MQSDEEKLRSLIRESIKRLISEARDKNIKLENGEFVIEKHKKLENVENKLKENFATIYFISSNSGSIQINPWVGKVINNSLSVFDYSHVGNYTKEIKDYFNEDPLIEIESQNDGSIIFRTVSNKESNSSGSIKIEKNEVSYFISEVSKFLDIPKRISFDKPEDSNTDDSSGFDSDDDSPLDDDDPFDSLNFN